MSVSVTVFLMVDISFRVVDFLNVRRFVVVVVVVRLVVVRLVVVVVMVSTENVCSVSEIGATAGQDVSACANHVLGEGELLAPENEEVSIFIESLLASSAFLLESLNSAFLVTDLMIVVRDVVIVLVDAVIVVLDSGVVVGDAVKEIIDVVV